MDPDKWTTQPTLGGYNITLIVGVRSLVDDDTYCTNSDKNTHVNLFKKTSSLIIGANLYDTILRYHCDVPSKVCLWLSLGLSPRCPSVTRFVGAIVRNQHQLPY